jgi:hypothetical protein
MQPGCAVQVSMCVTACVTLVSSVTKGLWWKRCGYLCHSMHHALFVGTTGVR